MTMSGKGRKKGDWLAVARGRASSKRVTSVSIGCPFNANHRSGSLASFYHHMNVCRG